MAYRAVPDGVVRCPWCEHKLPPAALECPSCRFPLAHPEGDRSEASTDGRARERSARGPDGEAQTLAEFVAARFPPREDSSQTPASSRASAEPGAHSGDADGRPRARHAHAAVLLGLVSLMLLVSSLVTLRSLTSPDARADRAAERSLIVALAGAQGQETSTDPVVRMPGGSVSTRSSEVSEVNQDGAWFGATRSESGRCFVLAGLVTSPRHGPFGTLGDDEPCTGDQARFRLANQLDPA